MNSCDKRAAQIRLQKSRLGIIEGVYNAKSSHQGGSLLPPDILRTSILKRECINSPTRSAGPRPFYAEQGSLRPRPDAALAERGYFSAEELKSLRHNRRDAQGATRYEGHAGCGYELRLARSEGVSAAVACACGKARRKDYRVYSLLGDSEIEEGQVWEAAMFAAHKSSTISA